MRWRFEEFGDVWRDTIHCTQRLSSNATQEDVELESVGLYIRVLLHKWVPPSSIISLNKYGIRIGVFNAVAPFRREVFSSFYELQSHESPCRPRQRSLPFIRRLIP